MVYNASRAENEAARLLAVCVGLPFRATAQQQAIETVARYRSMGYDNQGFAAPSAAELRVYNALTDKGLLVRTGTERLPVYKLSPELQEKFDGYVTAIQARNDEQEAAQQAEREAAAEQERYAVIIVNTITGDSSTANVYAGANAEHCARSQARQYGKGDGQLGGDEIAIVTRIADVDVALAAL